MKTKMLVTCLIFAVCLISPKTEGTIIFDDGGVHTIDYSLWNDDVSVQNGTTVNIVPGGIIEYGLQSLDNSLINISGDVIGGGLFVYHDSLTYIYDGRIEGSFQTSGQSQIYISGGQIEAGLILNDVATITIYGSDFMLDGYPVYDIIDSSRGSRLTGLLDDKTILDTSLIIWGSGTVILVPEPSTIILLGLGSLALLKRRKF